MPDASRNAIAGRSRRSGPAGAAPPEVTLTANGVPVELGAPSRIATILPGGGTGWLLSLPDFLSPSTAYELRGLAQWSSYVSDAGEPAVTLSQFTTASGYDKLEGTPPKIQSLRLWRVRYPKDEIRAGRCVFSEYHGFIEFGIEPASIPNTTAAGTLYTLRLAPETGGETQSISFVGSAPFLGRDPDVYESFGGLLQFGRPNG